MLNISRVEEAGLHAQSGPVPLESVCISVEVLDAVSRVSVVQRFKNKEANPIEAVYCFPLEEGSAVCGFEVQIGDRLIKGAVEEREEAFQAYDDAMVRGDAAILLDQEKPNIFVASVGNLLPGQEASVSISYVAELSVHDDQIRLMIPATVSPRYAPASADPVEVDVISPPVGLHVPYALSLNVTVRDASQIEGVHSPSHKVKVQQDQDVWKVCLAHSETKLDRDFILEINLKEPRKPSARIQLHENGDRAVMVRLCPEFESKAEKAASEVIFLLDCSGSMEGSSIAHAKIALESCLHTLSAGDRFNVVRFGSRFEKLFEQSREYTEENLSQGTAYLKKIKADLGGTEIYPALDHVLKIPLVNGLRRDLLLLTDGEVANDEKVIELAREHRNDARIFSFGIGYGSNENLVRGLARATGGVAEFMSPDESIEDKVIRQFSRLSTPFMKDVRIDWKGLKIKQSPAEIPPIFDGDSFTLYGLIEDGQPSEEVTLSAKIGADALSWSAPVIYCGAGNTIPTLWAKNHIRDIEQGLDLNRGSRQIARKASARKKNLIDVATRYQLMSSATSFVAIETRADADRSTELPVYRRVPIQLTRDWHGLTLMQQACVSSSLAEDFDAWDYSVRRATPRQDARPLDKLRDNLLSDVRVEPPDSRVQELIKTQEQDGSFPLTELLADLTGISLDDLKKLASEVKGAPEEIRETVLATALVVVFLKRRADNRDWTQQARKARLWLRANARGARLNGKPVFEGLRDVFSDKLRQWPMGPRV